MTILKIKGHEINSIHIKDSCDRRALQIKNNIIKLLSTIDVGENWLGHSYEMLQWKSASISFMVFCRSSFTL